MLVNGKTVYFSATTAKTILHDGPRAARDANYVLNPDKPKEQKGAPLRKGILIDRLVFGTGPEIVELPYDSWRTEFARNERDEIEKSYAIAALAHEIAAAQVVANGVTSYLAAQGIKWEPECFQRKLVYNVDGVDCKAILDYYDPEVGLVIDLKSCSRLSDDRMRNSAWSYRYDIQAAMYREATNGSEVVLVFSDSEDGHCMELYCDELVMAVGDHELRRSRKAWKNCLASNIWPETIEECEDVSEIRQYQ